MLALLGSTACGDDGGVDAADAAVDAAAADAAPDAGPDAFVRCPGAVLFTGDYLDWDSSDAMFKGVFDATVTDTNTAMTAQTAPNGRWELCVTAATEVAATVVQSDYLPVRVTAAAEVITAGAVSTRGLKPARADTLFSGFGFARDTADAQVLIEVRSHPSLQPVVGATVALTGATPEGSYGVDLAWALQSATTTGASGYMFFANVPVGGGSTPLTVTPPGGTTCVGPATIPLVAGEISAASFACD
jgi:hypothetical protein